MLPNQFINTLMRSNKCLIMIILQKINCPQLLIELDNGLSCLIEGKCNFKGSIDFRNV